MPQFESVALPPRLPLIVTTSNRDRNVDKDARLVNCYIETDEAAGEVNIYRRPGLGSFDVVANDEIGFGVYYWRGAVYSIFGSSLYKDGVEVATGLDTTNGVYKFDAILGATPKLILGNGIVSYSYSDGDGLSADFHDIDSDYPEEVVKGFAYLNGALYVMEETAFIHGSRVNDVDNPDSWDILSVIRAQIEPDNGVAISKQLVYVIAFKEWSTEVFFDAGNPTGSPLGPVQGSKSSFGCASADSIQRIDDALFFASTNQTASKQIVMIEQLTARVVSTPSIDRLLEGVSLAVVYSWQVKIDGHSFYVITFKNSNLTLAYDINQDLWHQWTDSEGNYFPIVSATYNADGERILQHENNGRLFIAGTQYYKDLNDPIVVDIYTPPFDAGTNRRKYLSYMEMVGDQIEGSTLLARYSDDDYQTWSMPRTIDLGSRKPYLPNCGTFVRRAYHFQHKSNTFFRLRAVNVQYDLGTL